jgi:hypothetical protein
MSTQIFPILSIIFETCVAQFVRFVKEPWFFGEKAKPTGWLKFAQSWFMLEP